MHDGSAAAPILARPRSPFQRLPPSPTRSRFKGVRATDHAPRFLPLAGTLNARDLGGLPLRMGGRTRPGVLIRADAPLQRTPHDHGNLNALGLSTIIDLREPNERARDPSAIKNGNGLAVHEIPIWQLMSDAGFEPTDPYDLNAFYRGLLDHAGAGFAAAVARRRPTPRRRRPALGARGKPTPHQPPSCA
jgi:hypothetical protein